MSAAARSLGLCWASVLKLEALLTPACSYTSTFRAPAGEQIHQVNIAKQTHKAVCEDTAMLQEQRQSIAHMRLSIL